MTLCPTITSSDVSVVSQEPKVPNGPLLLPAYLLSNYVFLKEETKGFSNVSKTSKDRQKNLSEGRQVYVFMEEHDSPADAFLLSAELRGDEVYVDDFDSETNTTIATMRDCETCLNRFLTNSKSHEYSILEGYRRSLRVWVVEKKRGEKSEIHGDGSSHTSADSERDGTEAPSTGRGTRGGTKGDVDSGIESVPKTMTVSSATMSTTSSNV